MITVQIVDDHKMFAEGIERIINESGIAQVIGKACNARECRQMLSERQADVLLLDIQLPDSSGLELCVEIRKIYPKLNILALTGFSGYSVVHRMLLNGASGYIFRVPDLWGNQDVTNLNFKVKLVEGKTVFVSLRLSHRFCRILSSAQ